MIYFKILTLLYFFSEIFLSFCFWHSVTRCWRTTVVYMMATLGGDDLHKDDCIFSCTFLPAECFRHIPHNVSSFYSNIVQYRFSLPTLHLLLKSKAKVLNTCSLSPHSLLTMFPPYTYYRTLCFQKH